jgi:hypothetical protein
MNRKLIYALAMVAAAMATPARMRSETPEPEDPKPWEIVKRYPDGTVDCKKYCPAMEPVCC